MEIVLKGIASGMLLAIMIGPVFFTIIQTSIERGFKHGVLVAVGVSLSDSLYIIITYLGLSQIIDNQRFKTYLTYGGGTMLLVFGVYYLFVKSKKLADADSSQIKTRNPLRYVAKGFIINGLTPVMFIFWITTMSVATTSLGYHTPKQVILFFGGMVCVVFSTDILKAKLADQLRHLMTARFIHILNVILGLVMIGSGVKLLFFTNHLW